jgi:hypothetical protein
MCWLCGYVNTNEWENPIAESFHGWGLSYSEDTTTINQDAPEKILWDEALIKPMRHHLDPLEGLIRDEDEDEKLQVRLRLRAAEERFRDAQPSLVESPDERYARRRAEKAAAEVERREALRRKKAAEARAQRQREKEAEMEARRRADIIRRRDQQFAEIEQARRDREHAEALYKQYTATRIAKELLDEAKKLSPEAAEEARRDEPAYQEWVRSIRIH